MLVARVKAARDARPWGPLGPPPLLVKIAPDLPANERKDVAAVAMRHGLQGLVVGNTTLNRPQPVVDHPCGHQVWGPSWRFGPCGHQPWRVMSKGLYGSFRGVLCLTRAATAPAILSMVATVTQCSDGDEVEPQPSTSCTRHALQHATAGQLSASGWRLCARKLLESFTVACIWQLHGLPAMAPLMPGSLIQLLKEQPHFTAQAGGLSGEPLREEADAALRDMYRLTGGKLPIIGCGGISTGRHAYQRIRAGTALLCMTGCLKEDMLQGWTSLQW